MESAECDWCAPQTGTNGLDRQYCNNRVRLPSSRQRGTDSIRWLKESESGFDMSVYVPRWASKLPIILARPRVAIDNNVLSDYYLRNLPDPDLGYVFEASNIVSCCSRQVINEALNAPDFSVASRQTMWTNLGNLQNQGRLF
jgi:hypothetical protein